jgi:ubiquinone/menaquinone biosynthesis C-methylase UbiE
MHMQKKKVEKKRTPNTTSWGGVAEWYNDYLGKGDTYQSEVIKPHLLRIVNPKKGDSILDLACGQGYFSHAFAQKGAQVVGCDIAPELIAIAKKNVPEARFVTTPATDLLFANDRSFDSAICVLAIQNIEDMHQVFAEVARVLRSDGRFIVVINHPAFRVIKRSQWGWDESAQVQYRRVDGYLSAAKIHVSMHPGEKPSEQTISYHRSLQDFFKAFAKAGFVVSRLEEWESHKVSGKGPRQKAEDIARKEIPLFMMIELTRAVIS